MGDLFANLTLGFSVAGSVNNLFFCFIGAMLGTLIGVLPGIGPLATLAMLLPITFQLPPEGALIMLAGIFYGAQYGGSTTSILINVPGESSAVVTALDGHAMAKQGRAGAALAIAAIGSFFAGCVATIAIAIAGTPLARVAQHFGAAEYFSLMVFGLVGAVVLASGSVIKATAMIILGLLLGLVGLDITSGSGRFTFGLPELSDGIGFVTVSLGLFGIAEIMTNLERAKRHGRDAIAPVHSLMPTRQDMREAWPAILRGTGVGTALGVLPGGGAVLAAFSAYTLEKKIAKDPERFGKGAIEGVAGPESANNAAAQSSFIPMLTLGIPSNAVMALMIGAMMIQGITPGPQVMVKQPALFWGIVASMWIGNLMLVIINLPLVGIWTRLLKVPYNVLFPAIIIFCSIGIYSLNNSTTDLLLTAGFGVMGYLFVKLGFEAAPLLLGFVLGPLMEENLRRATMMARGNLMTFIERPISLGLLIASLALLAVVVAPSVRHTREEAFHEEE
jgi:putative tricarboxylic transport membrane protein